MKERRAIVSFCCNKPARKSVRARWIVLTGHFNSSSNKNYVGTKFSSLKYDLQCTNFEPDKTYNTTMYVWPAKTRVSLCIDPLDKTSFLHTVRSVKGLNRMCCCSRTVYSALDSPAIDGKYDERMLLSECAQGTSSYRPDPKKGTLFSFHACKWHKGKHVWTPKIPSLKPGVYPSTCSSRGQCNHHWVTVLPKIHVLDVFVMG